MMRTKGKEGSHKEQIAVRNEAQKKIRRNEKEKKERKRKDFWKYCLDLITRNYELILRISDWKASDEFRKHFLRDCIHNSQR